MMTLFLTYELKVAILIAVFYIFWRLLVANETWHRLNRIVLLSTAVTSFILPLCVITIHQTVEVNPLPMETISEITSPENTLIQSEGTSAPVVSEEEHPFNWQQLLIIIYFIGVAIVLSRMLLSIWRLHRMAIESEIHPLADGRKIAVCEKAKTPFSWWKTVFLNHKDYEEGTTALLTHELEHLRLHHSVDVLLVEFLTALQWFNPAMWMLRSDLRTVHEYEADQQVLSHGFNDIQYLQLLIRKAVGQSGYSLANGIFNSALKKRVTMIMKTKSNCKRWIRFAYLLPIIAISLALSAKIQKEEVVSFEMNNRIEPLTNDNRLILLIDNLDDLKTLLIKKGVKRKVKPNLDFNGHVTRKSMDGKTIIVHLPQGTVYVNDGGKKKIETDLDYAFPEGGFEWLLNGTRFDEHNVPALHFMMLKKIENHWNGKKNVVDLITMEESAIILDQRDGKEKIGLKVPVGAFYTWLVNGHLAGRGVVKKDNWWNVRGYYDLDECIIMLDGRKISSENVSYVPLNSIKEVKLIQGEAPRRIELYTHNVSTYNREAEYNYPDEYKDNIKTWMFFTAEDAATGQQLKGVEITIVETGQKIMTNEEGWCELKVPLGTTIKASYPGFEDETYEIRKNNANEIQGKTFLLSKPSKHIYLNVDKEAVFSGDKEQWFANNIRLPKAADGKGISGRVSVCMVVNEDGSISGVRIHQGVNKSMNDEALRVVRSMPRWKPAIKDGKLVKSLVFTGVPFKNVQDVI